MVARRSEGPPAARRVISAQYWSAARRAIVGAQLGSQLGAIRQIYVMASGLFEHRRRRDMQTGAERSRVDPPPA
jgi:hypothetical protein